MTVNEKLRYVVEMVGAKQAATELGSLDKATQSVGKSSSVLSAGWMKYGAAATVAGGAVAAFAVKAVNAFQDTALAAGKFADITGMSVEQASRWNEVSSKWGISSEEMTVAFDKLNKAIAAGKLDRWGASVKVAADGTTDLNATFLALVDQLNSMPDSAKRAKMAADLLGRGWHSLAELVAAGSSDLRAELDAVTDAQVIDEGEIEKAKKFREAMDEVNDALGEISLSAGEVLVELAPVIELLAKGSKYGRSSFGAFLPEKGEIMDFALEVQAAHDAHDQGVISIGKYVTAEQSAVVAEKRRKAALEEVTTRGEIYGLVLGQVTDRTGEAAAASRRLAADMQGASQAIANANYEAQLLLGTLDVQDAADNFADQFDAIFEAIGKGDWQAAEKGARDLRRQVILYEDSLGKIPEQTRTEILTELDEGDLLAAQRTLDEFTRSRELQINVKLTGAGSRFVGRLGPVEVDGGKAAGGPVSAGHSYVVGERGPEVFMPGQSGSIVPNHKLGGATINVYATGGMGVSGAQLGREIAEALDDWYRVSGRGPI